MVLEFYFHPQSPPSQAVRMILRELGIACKEIEVDVFYGTPKPADFLAVNPKGKVPAIKDGTFLLAESRAIAMYLCTKYEPVDKPRKLYPKRPEEVAKMNEALLAQLDDDYFVDKYTNASEVFIDAGYGPLPKYIDLPKNVLKGMEASLQDHKYLFGNHLTVLDCFALATAQILDMSDDKIWHDYPRVMAWRKTMSELPYYEDFSAKPTTLSAAYYKEASEKMKNKK